MMPIVHAMGSGFTPVVLVVDHDAGARTMLTDLLASDGLRVEPFASVADLLRFSAPQGPSCLVMEMRLPGINGLDVQERLRSNNIEIPVIFVTGHGDIQVAVRAMKAGAVDFLAKPVREQDLLDAVHAALERDVHRRARVDALLELEDLFESLSSREQEVMWHVTAGLMNKQIAGVMGLSEITVKVHRGNVMRKMKSRSLAELVRKAQAVFGTEDFGARFARARRANARPSPGWRTTGRTGADARYLAQSL